MPRTRQARPPPPPSPLYPTSTLTPTASSSSSIHPMFPPPPDQSGPQPQYGQMPPPPHDLHPHQLPQHQSQPYYDGIYPGYGRATTSASGNWTNGNGDGIPPSQHVEGYQNAMAGPSRPQEPFQSYPSHRSSPSITNLSIPATQPGPRRAPLSTVIPPGPGWSSVHPGAQSNHSNNTTSMPPPRSNRGISVKLEDLVSQDAPRTVSHGQFQSPVPGGLTSVPLSVAQQQSERVKVAAAHGLPGPSSGTAGESAGSQGPSEFIKKLYKMLEEESVLFGNPQHGKRGDADKHGAVGWGRGGTSFVVWEMNDFTTKILPQTFRHSNFSSFVRQLNKYGFSKIKHVDEDTGQIKENVWEFQHPNFQAGGKSDLDSIKRKAVVPKKVGGEDRDGSPSRGLGAEETGRIMEMESRILSLEDRLLTTELALSEARDREIGIMNLMRDVIGQLGNIEKENSTSMTSPGPTARIHRLFQSFDQVASHIPQQSRETMSNAFVTPQPVFNSAPFSSNMMRFASDGIGPPQAHISPHTDGSTRSRSSGEHPSPSGSLTNPVRGQRQLASSTIPEQAEDVIELAPEDNRGPLPAQSTSFLPEQYTMGNNVFNDPSWMTGVEGGPFLPMNPRKSSDGTTLRMMAEALANQNSMNNNDDSQDPLDTTPRETLVESSLDEITTNSSTQAQNTANNNSSNMSTIAQSPFGTLLIPPQNERTQGNGIRLRRSTTIKPSWTQTPKILVVEDDVVYRQLSRKFLEKFGCQIEVVENAQVAIERMNTTKYDLVLMDIFFGPHMDGRKATSLIRQFDMYTPIISMTSNAQPQDVDSYLQSGMNDILAKPFTKHGLFGILDKHLIHLKAIQLSGEVPRFIGVPPLSDQGVVDAVATGAASWGAGLVDDSWRNPLVGMGWSDETYQLVLQQFMQTGAIPDVNNIINNTIGTNIVFGESANYNRKRSIESPGDDWLDEDKRDVKKFRNNIGGLGGGVGIVELE